MKYVVLLCDGMADLPREDLTGKTPMGTANKPNMDKLAKVSEVGLVKTVIDSLKPGSDVANLSVLGYDPSIYYSGRSPLEAGSIGIDMKPTDVSFRCNLVTWPKEGNTAKKIWLTIAPTIFPARKRQSLLRLYRRKWVPMSFGFTAG